MTVLFISDAADDSFWDDDNDGLDDLFGIDV